MDFREFFILAACGLPFRFIFSNQEDFAELEGFCPYCEAPARSNASAKSFQCRSCKLRVFVRDKKNCTLSFAQSKTEKESKNIEDEHDDW